MFVPIPGRHRTIRVHRIARFWHRVAGFGTSAVPNRPRLQNGAELFLDSQRELLGSSTTDAQHTHDGGSPNSSALQHPSLVLEFPLTDQIRDLSPSTTSKIRNVRFGDELYDSAMDVHGEPLTATSGGRDFATQDTVSSNTST